jgi:DNA-binding PadR family transcriptional regulator
MVKKSAPSEVAAQRNPGVTFLILSSLADGEKHGYALTKDIEHFAGVRVAAGTLYEALARLESQGFIEAVPTEDRRRPYRLSAAGAAALDSYVRAQERLVKEGRARLRRHWGVA